MVESLLEAAPGHAATSPASNPVDSSRLLIKKSTFSSKTAFLDDFLTFWKSRLFYKKHVFDDADGHAPHEA